MSLVSWQDSYCIGVSSIDDDHKILISLVNQLHDAREEGQTRHVVGSILNVLVEYCSIHFRREEQLMERSCYPELEAHKELHRRLCERVDGLQRQYESGHGAAAEELSGFLKEWLLGHILGVDVRIAPWVGKVESDKDISPIRLDR